jgi:glucose-6-phosphate dehydrogenase assembly protein OpcA
MAQAVAGEDVRVDVTTIEKQLAELWRAEKREHDDAVTRAALWNVVAHTWSEERHAHATEVLARVSESEPQRTIVIRADLHSAPSIASWISANCHLIGGDRQVCSEEVSVIASGDRVHHIAPLMKALLLPDMPVAVWWVGDLPDDREYAETLLDPADRVIVDSSHFDSPDDLAHVLDIAQRSTTAPADLNWARLEEWRVATATLFDPEAMRERLSTVKHVRVICGGDDSFGSRAAALLYAAWFGVQSGAEATYEIVRDNDTPGLRGVQLEFADGSNASIRCEREGGAVIAHSDFGETRLECVARALAHSTEDLIVRLLKRPEADGVYLKALKAAPALA